MAKGRRCRSSCSPQTAIKPPPVKNPALKDFLNEGTDLKAKPTIDIVNVLPPVEMEGAVQTQTYRSGDDWKTIIAAINLAKDKQERDTKLALAARDWNAESQRVTAELQTIPDSQVALAAQETLRKVAPILKMLTTGPQLPPLPQTPPPRPGQQPPPQQQVPPQMPPLPSTPPPKRPVPLNPVQQEEPTGKPSSWGPRPAPRRSANR